MAIILMNVFLLCIKVVFCYDLSIGLIHGFRFSYGRIGLSFCTQIPLPIIIDKASGNTKIVIDEV